MMNTWTLVGVCLGVIVGLVVQQLPFAASLGLAIGAGIDSWMHRDE